MQRKWLIAIPLILVLLGLCALIGAILVFNYPRLSVLRNVHVNLSTNSTTAESDETKSFEIKTPASLVVDGVCANVRVVGDQSGQVRIDMHKRAYGTTKTQAQSSLEKMVVDLSQSGNTVTVTVENTNNQTCPLAAGPLPPLEFTIGAPADTQVQVRTSSGSISLEGTALPADLTSAFGDISVKNLSESLSATTSNGRITAQAIQAGDREISLKTSFGAVNVDHSNAATLSVMSENGEITLTSVDVSGASQVSSQFGALNWTGGKLDGLQLSSTNGEISLTNLNLSGALSATTNFGDLSLSNVEAENYALTTLNGAITVDKASGAVKAKSDFGDIQLTNIGKVNFDLASKNGSIVYQGELGDGTHSAITQFGNIRFELPSESAFDFDLQTSFGEIRSEFNVSIQGAPNEHHWQGQVNGGGPLLTAQTTNGNITLAVK
jgi:DUF4097 and DUF4098 domain-containing protein YvlB